MKKVLTLRTYTYAIIVAGLLLLLGVLIAPGPLQAAMKPPKDFAMTETKDKPHVIFSHEKHVKDQGLKCSNCHTKIFQMKKGKTEKKMGAITMAAMEEGKFCGACHNGDKAFTVKDENNCVKCHSEK